jgi:hypothetical protein
VALRRKARAYQYALRRNAAACLRRTTSYAASSTSYTHSSC